MNRIVIVVVAAAVVLAALGAGYWWGRSQSGSPATGSAGAVSDDREVLYWYDPMVPDQHFDKPGKSPFMDMMLVPKYADEAAGGGISIAPGMRQSLGIRVAPAELGRLESALTVPGTLGWDLRAEHVISMPVDGVVSRLHVKTPFESVHAGQPLVNVLAPRWSVALAEAGALDGAGSASAQALRSAAQQRLRALGLPSGARAAGDGSIVLISPVTGVVSEIGVREGDAAMPGTMLLRVNGADTMWLVAAVPQADVAGLRAGTPVQARVSAFPGRQFTGEVEALLPDVDPSSRTQQARIVLDNPEGLLAPGMFAEVGLQPERGKKEVLLVPTDAVIGAGERSHVIVRDENDRFVPVAVRTGRSSGGRTEILSGLKGGEPVVVSGQFLIDSEASLSGALERLNAASEESAETESAPGNEQERKCEVEYWHDPMVPDRHFDEPGQSPFMDMMLVPRFTDASSPDCTVDDVQGAAKAEAQS
ncbi:efflux RND transporter periplasmic adaptor subunit [Luteimonas salinilitoris]|uniref:Efflux RND transporter periplasmic adaptor subunit n=1 Tax=Luteimonas salinilitoris TaxID=3237697 RepID=A0ABV4HLQ9_9GAMM